MLPLLALGLVLVLAVIGLSVDLGLVYLVRDELQVFADEAAVAAAFELDGTADGLDRAAAAARTGPTDGKSANRYYFASREVEHVETAFAAAAEGPYETAPLSAGDCRFARVRVSEAVPLYLLPLLPNVSRRQVVGAQAVALRSEAPEPGGRLRVALVE